MTLMSLSRGSVHDIYDIEYPSRYHGKYIGIASKCIEFIMNP